MARDRSSCRRFAKKQEALSSATKRLQQSFEGICPSCTPTMSCVTYCVGAPAALESHYNVLWAEMFVQPGLWQRCHGCDFSTRFTQCFCHSELLCGCSIMLYGLRKPEIGIVFAANTHVSVFLRRFCSERVSGGQPVEQWLLIFKRMGLPFNK